MTVVWAHLGLSKELKNLHPKIHAFIIEKLMAKYAAGLIAVTTAPRPQAPQAAR
jgi:hypothetical protein